MNTYIETAPPMRPPLLRLSHVELRKMADTRAGFWLLAVVALIAIAIMVVILVAGNAADQDLATIFSSTVAGASVLLPVLGILAVTSEWSQRTALTTFTLVPERGRVVTAKVLAGLALGLVSVVVCLAASAIGNLITDGSWSLGGAAIGNAALYQTLSMLGGLALGLLFLNSPLAIVMYFVLPTVWGILGELIDALPADWLDTARTMTPLVENEMSGGDWARLATSCALWILLPFVVGLLRLRRAEVKSA
jgi:ABC-2 type transport system permease protein